MSPRILVLSIALLGSVPAQASTGMCPTDADRSQLLAFRDRIAAAKTPQDAKEMAYKQTRLGHAAIRRAAEALPGDDGIAEADARLATFDAGVAGASTQAEVAAQFDTLMQTQAQEHRCDYTPSEVAIIVIGFLLGILPGILFLFLFC